MVVVSYRKFFSVQGFIQHLLLEGRDKHSFIEISVDHTYFIQTTLYITGIVL